MSTLSAIGLLVLMLVVYFLCCFLALAIAYGIAYGCLYLFQWCKAKLGVRSNNAPHVFTRRGAYA